MVALKRVEGYLDRKWGDDGELFIYDRVKELYETPEGVLYVREQWSDEGEPDPFLRPFGLCYLDKNGVLPGHRTDSAAPYICWRCHTDRVQCFQSDSYETSIRCPDCGTETVVHSG